MGTISGMSKENDGTEQNPAVDEVEAALEREKQNEKDAEKAEKQAAKDAKSDG